MYICRTLRRPLVLIWEQNSNIGNTKFSDLFDNVITTVSQKPSAIPIVLGDRPQTEDSFPANMPIILECHDICQFPGLNDLAISTGLQSLLLAPAILSTLTAFTKSHDIANFLGIHVRKGDKWHSIKSSSLRSRVESQYDIAIREIVQSTGANLYLACDDPKTWKKYKRMYGKRIFCAPKSRNPLRRDKIAIAEALLDLYLLSKTKFILYGIGTFGYAAHLLGGNLARNILCSKKEFFFFFHTIQGLPLNSFPDVNEIVNEIAECIL